MIVPGSQLTMDPSLLKQDNLPRPSQTNLLMAAAEMHKMGRLAGDRSPIMSPGVDEPDRALSGSMAKQMQFINENPTYRNLSKQEKIEHAYKLQYEIFQEMKKNGRDVPDFKNIDEMKEYYRKQPGS